MNFSMLIISFFGALILVTGFLIVLMRYFFFSSMENEKNRLDKDTKKAHEKQIELSRKLKESDEELETRRKEANELVSKMQSEIESTAKEEREKIIKEARTEGESIIEKAQEATVKLKLELEKEMDIRAVNFSMDILNKILSGKAKTCLNQALVEEFIEDLKNTDMTNISPEVAAVDVISLATLDDHTQKEITNVINGKLERELAFTYSIDPDIGGGIIIKFGTLALDGSIKNLIREEGIALKTKLDE